MKKNSWRLTSDLIAYFPCDLSVSAGKRVFLASPEKKSYKAAVQKNIESVFDEVIIESNSFKLKVSNDLSVYVKCDEFPDPEQYYLVCNMYRTAFGVPMIGNIITQVKSDKANFGDTVFEAVFSEDSQESVYFMTPEMAEYKSAFEEMKRRMNCTLNKKVKKWIPGGRYDTLTNTYYYLGEFKSRKKNELNSDFLGDSSMVPAYLYVSELGDEKKISDILKTRKIGSGPEDIQIMYSLPSAVDSGNVLENDITCLKDYQKYIFDNSMKEYTITSDYGFSSYSNPKYILDILSLKSSESDSYADLIPESVSEMIKNMLHEVVLCSWDLNKNREDIYIGEGNNNDKNAENLVRRFYQDFKDGNAMRNLYYRKLFIDLGININEIAVEVVSQGNPESLILSGIENYVSLGSIYFKNHFTDASRKISRQRIKSTNYTLEVVKLSDLFSATPNLLLDIKDLIENARNNFGLGVRTFYYTNTGTKKSPKIYTTIEVDILDLIKYYGGIKNIPEVIVNEIISSKFWNLQVLIDKEGVLE